MREFGPVRGHEVCGLHGAQGDYVFVGAAIAHHADAFYGEEDGEGLGGVVVPGLMIRCRRKTIPTPALPLKGRGP